MASALQNRLVGTIIVVALVIILVPEFLDGEKKINKQEFIDVPPMGDLVEVESIEPFDTSAVQDAVQQNVELVDEQAVDEQFTGETASLSANQSTSVNNEEKTLPVVKNLSSPSISETQRTTEDAATNIAANQNKTNKSDKAREKRSITLTEKKKITITPSSTAQTKPVNQSNTVSLDGIELKEAGWVVQLGSFRHEKNVKELLKTLNNAGYRAYSRPVMTTVGELNKVFVGPELDKDKLESALPHLQELTNLKGKITAFEVSAG